MDPSQEILFEVTGQIATITFNRPEAMNALTWNMYDRLVTYCEELDRRDDIRVAILRGTGERAFVSGTDISQFQAFSKSQEALNLGVVTEIVPADQLETRTGEVAERLTQLAPLTLAATKESIRRIQAVRAPDREDGEDLILSCYMSDDFRGAVQAFVEKRKHVWT